MTTRTAAFGGTFDPVTYGHLDLIRRAAALYDRVLVCVARAGRPTLLPAEERVRLIRDLVTDLPGVEAEPFDGLLVEHARARGARVLLRGLRGARDAEVEMQMAHANRALAPEVETVLLAASPGTALVSSTLVREVASLGGDVSAWVPPAVAAALEARGASS